MDDTYLQSSSFEECVQNDKETVELFEDLGFVVSREKSVLTPVQRVKVFWFE